ncbi:hypothetical protein SAMN06295998_11710 [Primorskyibacter flagellatus]|uniref:Uncharacterized protein n=1 Tax=Primorskyibacter flagellatus TaxID=1387277 RepID=A0A1W2DS98_9RHOB|nr:hypothetical protein SAMN06295998_11710 [Primorskyibacter flagellatus]
MRKKEDELDPNAQLEKLPPSKIDNAAVQLSRSGR